MLFCCPSLLLALSNHSVDVSLCIFLSQHRVTGDLCWSVETDCSQHCEGLNLVLLWFWCWLTSRPPQLRPNSRTGSGEADKGLHFLLDVRVCV